jgi:hypothetical protein
MTNIEAESMIWDFLERVSYVMMEDYRGDNRRISVDDLRMIRTYTVNTSNGIVRKLSGDPTELPFRTRNFFNHTFTDVKRSYQFFNQSNKANGIKWLREKVLMHSGRFDLLDWCANGRIAHVDAIFANYSASQTAKRSEI